MPGEDDNEQMDGVEEVVLWTGRCLCVADSSVGCSVGLWA